MIIVGIDPGASGAIAIDDGRAVGVRLMPWVQNVGLQTDQIAALIPPGATVFVEEIQSRVGQGVKQAQSSGIEFGRLLERLKVLGARVQRIPANRWKSQMGLVEKARRSPRVPGIKKEPPPVYPKGSPERKAQAQADRERMKVRKNASIAMAQSLFPMVSLLPTVNCTVPHDGMAEALLILEYGRRQLNGGRKP